MSSTRLSVLALAAAAALALAPVCSVTISPGATIPLPFADQLSQVGNVQVRVVVPPDANPANLVVTLDTNPIVLTPDPQNAHVFEGAVNVASAGAHQLKAMITGGGFSNATRDFETVDLQNADQCEVLNAASCLLPFPSDRFLDDAPGRPAGFNPKRMMLPQVGFPVVPGEQIDPVPYMELDGFSPTAPILMHLSGTPDLALSGASRLLPPGAPVAPPYVDTRTSDDTSVQPTTPTILLEASTGTLVPHWVELDARAAGNPARQTFVMRTGVALKPGERYIVALRNLVDGGGAAIAPEPAFAVLRDNRFTDIPAIFQRRPHFENEIFAPLTAAGVNRQDLILAFDFTVQSDEGLTGQVISMRDQALTWLAGQAGETFSVDSLTENDCGVPGETTWRIVRGTYEVPLYLTEDPELIDNFGVLNLDPSGVPVQNGLTHPPFTISIPCTVLAGGGQAADHAMVVGHGLFGSGDGFIGAFSEALGSDYIAGATNWRGLSSADQLWIGLSIIGFGSSGLNHFPAFPDRLKQGQINTQVLSRMMKNGVFNSHACFQVRTPNPADCTTAGPDGGAIGTFPGASAEMFYYGISLGGIMGTWYAALNSDVERFNLDVPAMNFATLLQRSTQFASFESVLQTLITDPLDTILGLSLLHELWVRAEPAGFVHQLAPDVASNAKKILLTVAWLDKQVSNQATEVLARTLGLTNLDASIQQGLYGIPDAAGPLSSAMVIYDTGSFDIFDPAQQGNDANGKPIIPALANLLPSPVCDPHARRVRIPASRDQLAAFLQPGGTVQNFCVGLCDATIDYERPDGVSPTCDPLAP